MTRIFLFVATNIAVLAGITVLVHLLGFDHWLTARGINYGALLGFSLVIGYAFDRVLRRKNDRGGLGLERCGRR